MIDKKYPEPFRSELAYTIFKNKYAHEGCETWEDLAKTLVEDVCGDHMDRDSKDQLTKYIKEMKFIPGGRYLYYAGRPNKFFNNCGIRTNKLLTDKGMKNFGDFKEGETLKVFSPVSKKFEKATMHYHGEQEVYEYKLQLKRNNGKHKEFSVLYTENHKWPTVNRGEVEDLKEGDTLSFSTIDIPQDDLGFIHGACFADANTHKCKKHYGHQLRLCGEKIKYSHYFDNYNKTFPKSTDGEPCYYIRSSYSFKDLPLDMPVDYQVGFLNGWLAFDGCKNERSLSSINKEAMLWFVENCFLIGKESSSLFEISGETNLGERTSSLWSVSLTSKKETVTVISKDYHSKQEVLCPFEPIYNRIVVDYGLDTFNCYLLRAEEDSREDWAHTSWKSERCLMTGGGIGVDYSIYRPKGAGLRRTGGVSSGPVPKMMMINEIGRHVMQGGSRRSAIYASLNHKHGDIEEFLEAKNWHNMPIGTSDLTIADAKQQDFNFHAPLDMTNVSVNYDTAWLENYYKTGEVGDVFLKNCEQALTTGEPGFSFNFYDKENETLRNACTEVTSEDDSDVLNLGTFH